MHHTSVTTFHFHGLLYSVDMIYMVTALLHDNKNPISHPLLYTTNSCSFAPYEHSNYPKTRKLWISWNELEEDEIAWFLPPWEKKSNFKDLRLNSGLPATNLKRMKSYTSITRKIKLEEDESFDTTYNTHGYWESAAWESTSNNKLDRRWDRAMNPDSRRTEFYFSD